ncbi:MAG: PIG-L deacetylase family protein [Microthrixaceae bacterium]
MTTPPRPSGPPTRVLVVSPHFDDAPLSLGQSLLDGALADCDVRVHVVFGRTNWTRWVHPTPARAPVVSLWRRGEELLASRSFGYRLSVGRAQEALLRGVPGEVLLDPERAVAGDPLLNPLRADLAAAVSRARPDLVLFPAGVGGHVDHQLLAYLGAETAADGVPVGFYEDRPYAAWDGADGVRAQLTAAGLSDPHDVSAPVGEALHRRLRRCYPSQLDDDFLAAMTADRDGRSRERVWWPAPARGPEQGPAAGSTTPARRLGEPSST